MAVTGAASFLALLVFLYGARILRKVRRVALSGRAPPSLRMLAIPMRQGTHTNWSLPRRTDLRTQILVGRRPTLMDRIFRRKAWRKANSIQTSDPCDPVWINEKADQARARDAFMAGWTGRTAPKGDWDEVRTALKDFDENWKSGKVKAKWARE